MKKFVRIIRVDPDTETVAGFFMPCGRSNQTTVREVQRIVRAKVVGHHKLCVIGLEGVALSVTDNPAGVPLRAAAGLDAEMAQLRWKLPIGDDTAGISILFGEGPGGGMVDCPVSVDWVQKNITWLPAENND